MANPSKGLFGNGSSLWRAIFGLITNPRTRRILLLAFVLTAAIFLFFLSTFRGQESVWTIAKLPFTRNRSGTSKSSCSPKEYANGTWIHRPYYTRKGPLTKTYHLGTNSSLPFADKDGGDSSAPPGTIRNMTKSEDIHTFTRFKACASSREYWWHLAADQETQFDRFPGPTEWEWVPGGRCTGQEQNGPGLRDWDREEVVKELVEGGGWLLIGDSVTENHFFSLSCLLYPHVIGRPDYSILTTAYDRSWPQHLYLNPESPIVKDLHLPIGFNFSVTPLVTFRRVDLLWSQDDLKRMHRELRPEYYRPSQEGPPDFVLFSDVPVWTISPQEYFDIFTQPLPKGNYATMVVGTAGHWTTGLFTGYAREEDAVDDDEPLVMWGYNGLIQFYRDVMTRWVVDIQHMIDKANAKEYLLSTHPIPAKGEKVRKRRDRKVLVRAYLPGHEDCHKVRSPWDEIQPFQWNWWNWAEIWRFNDVFRTLLSKGHKDQYPDVHYLPIDRPARLRPDAHSTADCLHIMSGAGVLEGWSHYIWHFITREI